MKKDIKVKVCGLTDSSNIELISGCGADFFGFIFYRNSKRYVGNSGNFSLFSSVPAGIQKVGVFVNEKPETILRTAESAGLDVIQLHGKEPIYNCKMLKSAGLTVIKAFGVGAAFKPETTDRFSDVCDYFLFDKEDEVHGGSGKKFNWDQVLNYLFEKPFFIGGGIGPEDSVIRKAVVNNQFYGVDINSRFEISPGIKDAIKVKKFIREIREEIYEI